MHGLFGRLAGLIGTVSGETRDTHVLAVEDSRHVFGPVAGVHFVLPLGGPFPVQMFCDLVGGPHPCVVLGFPTRSLCLRSVSFLASCGYNGMRDPCLSLRSRGLVLTLTTKPYEFGHGEGDTDSLRQLP